MYRLMWSESQSEPQNVIIDKICIITVMKLYLSRSNNLFHPFRFCSAVPICGAGDSRQGGKRASGEGAHVNKHISRASA